MIPTGGLVRGNREWIQALRNHSLDADMVVLCDLCLNQEASYKAAVADLRELRKKLAEAEGLLRTAVEWSERQNRCIGSALDLLTVLGEEDEKRQ